HNRYLQKPYAVYLYSHSVYIYIAAEVFSQTAVRCNSKGQQHYTTSMTLTRTYYNQLIELLTDICSVKDNDPLTFSQLKKDISNILNRISKFYFIPLTFTKDFWSALNEKTHSNFLSQKLLLVNELHFELHECLYTTRLRYGGELMFYLFELKLAVLSLPVNELNQFEKIIKIPEHYYLRNNVVCNTESEKTNLIKRYRIEQKNSIVSKKKVVIKEKTYELIETSLKKDILVYQNYIGLNFPSIASQFSFYRKKIRAYLTQAISSEMFEFRIHAYESAAKNSSINLLHQYYDFYPAYFYNLEEITNKQTGATVTSLNKADLTFTNPFTQDFIFRELINIYLTSATQSDISKFTEFLLKCHFYKIAEMPKGIEPVFDLIAEKDDKKFVYEIYHHKARSLDKIFERIQQIKNVSLEYSISFVFSSYPGELIVNQLSQNNIASTYILDLIEKVTSVGNKEIIEWYVKDKLQDLKPVQTPSTRFAGETLLTRLSNCPAGEKNWSEYESLGIDIFRFLFEDSFRSYIAEEQVGNDLKNHRRDLIVSNYFKDATSFWAEAKQLYQSKAIIVDFKNYSEKLNSTSFFSVSKYTTKNVGNFALVFSRKGLDKTAMIEQRSLYTNGKLLIEFNDVELREMILEKIIGNDPLDRLKSKEFQIITS
ncbi:MAG: hypothetical protein SGI96_18875, partial [Bacteroidota bacterium]|nr:hypothetical protein [Bacteroidota bacterium]